MMSLSSLISFAKDNFQGYKFSEKESSIHHVNSLVIIATQSWQEKEKRRDLEISFPKVQISCLLYIIM